MVLSILSCDSIYIIYCTGRRTEEEESTDYSPLTIEIIQQVSPSQQPTISVSIKMTIQNGSTTTIGNVGRAIASRIRGSKSRMEGTTTEIGQDTNKVKTMDNWKKFQRMEQIPSLKDFMHTQKVKKQYRNFLRATKNITDPVFYNQAKHEIRQMYASVKNDSDSLSISMAFQEVSFSCGVTFFLFVYSQ